MKIHYMAPAALLLVSGTELGTDYGQKRALRVESKSTYFIETTDMTILRDGEPIEGRGMGGNSSETVHEFVQIIDIKESSEGEPTVVRHTFESVGGNAIMSWGENERENELESPFAEAVIELRRTDDGLEVEVVEGDVPEELLDRLGVTLAFDGLLPDGDASVDDSWSLDSDAIKRAIGLDMREVLYPAPEREEQPEGEGRRGGGRGGRGGGGGGSRMMNTAEWEGKATLTSLNVDHEGIACAEVALEIECSYDIPEREAGGGGRGRGGRSVDPVLPGSNLVEGQFTVELEGRLLFSIEEKRPVLFELEGDVSSENSSERTRGESTMSVSQTQEGSLSISVEISVQETE